MASSSLIVISRAVTNKYAGNRQSTTMAVDGLEWAVERHEQAVRWRLPTVALMFHFSEVYQHAVKALEEWKAGKFGYRDCTLMPMLESAISTVSVPDMELLEKLKDALHLLSDVIVFAPGSRRQEHMMILSPLAAVGVIDEAQVKNPRFGVPFLCPNHGHELPCPDCLSGAMSLLVKYGVASAE